MAKQRSEEHAGLPLISALTVGTAICSGLLYHSTPERDPSFSLSDISAIGALLGGFSGAFYWNGFRGLGSLPYCLSCGSFFGLWALCDGWNCVSASTASFVIAWGWLRAILYIDRFHRNSGMVLPTLFASMIALGLAAGNPGKGWQPIPVHWYVSLTGLLALLSWLFLLRPAIELGCEPIIRLQYRIRSVGPGVQQIPTHGPSIVIANHACWFDPFFLALLLPRPITPMMTSDFYDLPVARWLLKRVFHAIRVPEKSLKQDIPDEIREAIAALDRGECVVIFPEGMLRRSEEKPLKRFGRGVWQILAARPHTPVFACWIEGGWRSYCSYFNGPPTKNKRPDFRRRIAVAVPAPITVDAETLSKHLTTRIALMNAVLESRKLLDLPEVPAFDLPKVD